MKKTKLFLIICLFLVIVGCSKKKPITKEEFTNIMEQNKFDVSDNLENYITKLNINEAYIAKNDHYEIEYFIYDSVDTAKSYFAYYQDIYEEQKQGGEPETADNMGNVAKYTIIINNNYSVLSRVENTLIKVEANEKYRTDIKKMVKNLGY